MIYQLLVAPFGEPFLARALVEALLLGVLGGVVSVFVVLRRLAFLAEALTHTVFPGVVIGFLVAQSAGIVWGALLFAVLSAVLLTVLATNRRVTEDATLAVLLTAFFAVGVILTSRRSSYTADLTTFLFGRILYVDATQIVETAVVGVAALAVLAALRKELLLRAFDPDGAAALGYPVPLLDLALNVAVALVVVSALKAVGTVLVIALLVVPAATGRLLSDRLAVVTTVSVLSACAAGWLGLVASYHASVSYGLRLASGATVVLVLVGCYALAVATAGIRGVLRGKPRPRLETPPAPLLVADERP